MPLFATPCRNMGAKVFISCGQRPGQEADAARQLKAWFEKNGYEPYVAIEVKSVFDLNVGIVKALKQSDYFIFIDFPREDVQAEKRGSLYSHQEFAMAYALDFQSIITIRHAVARHEGLAKYLVSNAGTFAKTSEILKLVQSAINSVQWRPDYSRGLVAANAHFGKNVCFTDHTRWPGRTDHSKIVRACHVHLENHRNSEAAFHVIARLVSIEPAGKRKRACPDKSNLKASGCMEAYSQTIWPNYYGSIDAFLIRADQPSEMYLSSALDVSPREPILRGVGKYVLHYEALADGYPLREFKVEVELTNNVDTAKVRLLK